MALLHPVLGLPWGFRGAGGTRLLACTELVRLEYRQRWPRRWPTSLNSFAGVCELFFSMRWIKRGLIIVAATFLGFMGLVIAYLAAMDAIGETQARAFYEKRKLLAQMRDGTSAVGPR